MLLSCDRMYINWPSQTTNCCTMGSLLSHCIAKHIKSIFLRSNKTYTLLIYFVSGNLDKLGNMNYIMHNSLLPDFSKANVHSYIAVCIFWSPTTQCGTIFIIIPILLLLPRVSVVGIWMLCCVWRVTLQPGKHSVWICR